MTTARLLITALDWGLGHASRCVPLIEALQHLGAELHLASSGPARQFWRQRFPELPVYALPGYAVRYSAGPRQWPTVLRQVPRLLRVIRAEQAAVETLVQQHGLHAVISDHRYGAYSRRVPSVWLGHQLALRLPPGLRSLQPSLARWHARWLRPFAAHWVPDWPPPHGLAGALVSEYPLADQLRFWGPLSRLSPASPSLLPPTLRSETAPYVALLSGPEPPRSQLEARLQAQAAALAAPLWIVQGQPGPLRITPTPWGRLISFADGPTLAALLGQARAVIARSGYSSLMDFAALQLPRLLLVPTPGQTEQEYLAQRWQDVGWAISRPQAQLDLSQALQHLEQQPRDRPPSIATTEDLHDRLADWLAGLRLSISSGTA